MTGWTKVVLAAFLLLAAAFTSAPAPARATVDPTPPSTAQLETRANLAFNRGEYANALPILKKLTETFKDEPARLGPLQEKIRVCEKVLASLKTIPARSTRSTSSGQASSGQAPVAAIDPYSSETRKPHRAAKPGELVEMSIKELGNFEYDQEHGGNIPADVKALTGVKIRLRGFMVPINQAENITQFALVPSLFECCQLGGPPQIQHTIVCECPKGKAIGYCPDEIVVEGLLKVEEKKDDTYIVSIFGLGVTSVRPAPK